MTARDDDDEQQRRRDEFEIKRGEAEAQRERHAALIEDGTEYDGGCRLATSVGLSPGARSRKPERVAIYASISALTSRATSAIRITGA